MVMTIETDPTTPFGGEGVPPAEWIYRSWLDAVSGRGPAFIESFLADIAARTGHTWSAIPTFPRARSLAASVDAYVNHDRWMWDCRVCNASQACTPVDPRAFCIDCFNGGDGWWPVVFPAERTALETLLARRPDRSTRNWLPTETLHDIQIENVVHHLDGDLPNRPLPDMVDTIVRPIRARLGIEEGD